MDSIETIVKGKITINDLLAMARGIEILGRQLITDLDKDLKKIERLNEGSIILGKVTSANILLSFASELALTALYVLDHPEKTTIPQPRDHSLSFWWKKIKKETQNKICKKFEEIENKEEKTIENVEKLLKKSDKSHTSWRYWWKEGYATGRVNPNLTMAIIDIGCSYPLDQINRELQKGIDGHKNFDKTRKG